MVHSSDAGARGGAAAAPPKWIRQPGPTVAPTAKDAEAIAAGQGEAQAAIAADGIDRAGCGPIGDR